MSYLTANDFAGRWVLQRNLHDQLGVMDGTLVGHAMFEGDGDGLRYVETGTLTLVSGGVMQASRVYRWQFKPAGIAVRFADGSAFHGFTPTGKSSGTPHLCGADLYSCDYDFTGWPVWTASWVVVGPRKDYRSYSVYERA